MHTPHLTGDRLLGDEEMFETLHANLARFGGNAGWVREHMTRRHWVNDRPLAPRLQPGPWSNGRIVLIGDAIHAASRPWRRLAVESAIVLALELARHDIVEARLQAYQERRFEQCRDVVETGKAVGAATRWRQRPTGQSDDWRRARLQPTD